MSIKKRYRGLDRSIGEIASELVMDATTAFMDEFERAIARQQPIIGLAVLSWHIENLDRVDRLIARLCVLREVSPKVLAEAIVRKARRHARQEAMRCLQ